MWHWRLEVNDAENTAFDQIIKHILLYILTETVILICYNYFTVLQFLLYFWSITCSLDEQKRLLPQAFCS